MSLNEECRRIVYEQEDEILKKAIEVLSNRPDQNAKILTSKLRGYINTKIQDRTDIDIINYSNILCEGLNDRKQLLEVSGGQLISIYRLGKNEI